MPYRDILKDLVDRTPDAIGAIMVDWEGEAVQEYCHCEPYEIRFVAAHKAIILGKIKDIFSECGQGGAVEDLVVTSSEAHLIIGAIDEYYSLMLNVPRNCPLHIALHNFREALAALKKEI